MLYAVLEKTAPMPEQDVLELRNDAQTWYKDQLAEADAKREDPNNVKPLSLKDKAILQCETWYMRTFFAIFYIYLVRLVQDFMNPPKEKYINDDDDYID